MLRRHSLLELIFKVLGLSIVKFVTFLRMAGNQVNFVALLNGLAEELNLPRPTYYPAQPQPAGLCAAVCHFGTASATGSGDSIRSARNAAACVMWANLGNGVRVNPR